MSEHRTWKNVNAHDSLVKEHNELYYAWVGARDRFQEYREERNEAIKLTERLRLERDHLRAELKAVKERAKSYDKYHAKKNAELRAELDNLRDEIKQLKLENGNLPEIRAKFEKDFAAVLRRAEKAEAELAARQSAPVKVRLPSVEVVNGHLIENNWSTTTDKCMEEALRFAAAHAVIDVLPGVPSVEELMEIGDDAYRKSEGGEHGSWYKARATAIRDAVIAGLAAKTQALTEREAEPTDAQVEELARVLCHADNENEGETFWHNCVEVVRESYRREARAAIAHMKPLPVDPDAWKTPLFLQACDDGCGDKFIAEENYFAIIHVGDCSSDYSGHDAARASQWLASFAAAHGRPVDLRTKADKPIGELRWTGDCAEFVPAPGMRVALWMDGKRLVPEAEPAETLEQLAEIGCESAARLARTGPVPDSKEYNLAFTAAIMRAARPVLDVSPGDIEYFFSNYSLEEAKEQLNSRIRYTVGELMCQRCEQYERQINRIMAVCDPPPAVYMKRSES
jgi:hypothetical protein